MNTGDPVTSFGLAWLGATITLAVHVTDEAMHDFLSWYNPRARRIQKALGGLPFPPTFTFVPWLVLLIAAVLLLASLTPAAFRGEPWMRPPAYIVATIYLGNGLMHATASIAARRPLPGVLSAPLLLVAGAWLAYAAAVLPRH